MKSALLFSCDPGGSNAVIPLVSPLTRAGYSVNLYGRGMALNRYADAGIHGRDITAEIDHLTPRSVAEFLGSVSPDIVVTGTSADDFSERYLWKGAGELGIPSMAILDQWTNYGIRFSPYSPVDGNLYEISGSHPFLPSRIAVMDEYAREEAVADGLPADRIVVCGQPYLEGMFRADRIEDHRRLRDSHDISEDEFVVIFASQPISAAYGPSGERWGYTEQTILSRLLSALETIAGEVRQRIALIIRPHPRENRELLGNTLGKYRNIRSLFDDAAPPRTLMNGADFVCGMWSMFLIESVILGVPTLSIQIGLNRESPFVLDRRKILRSIRTERELDEQLREIIINRKRPEYSFEVIRNPVERILAEMEKMLCPNSP